MKKGNKSWKPNDRLTVKNVPEGYVARWVDTEQANYERKQEMGYVPVSSVTNPSVKHEHPGLPHDGKPLTTLKAYRGMELMLCPKEDYEAHREYYAEQTLKQTAGLKRKAVEENAANARGGNAAQVYGKIVIE